MYNVLPLSIKRFFKVHTHLPRANCTSPHNRKMHTSRHSVALVLLMASASLATSAASSTPAFRTSTFLPPPTFVSHIKNAATSTTELTGPSTSTADLWTSGLSALATESATPSGAASSRAPSPVSDSAGTTAEVNGLWMLLLALLGVCLD